MKEFRLYIAIPSTQSWDSKMAMATTLMCNYLSSQPLPGVQKMAYQLNNKTGSILANMRQDLVYQARDWKATHLLFIDSDQTFPRDLVHRLMQHRKQVIACNISTKSIEDCSPTARRKSDTKWAGDLVYTERHSKGVQKVWRVGTGIMLLNMNIFENPKLGYDDLFPQVWNPEIKNYNGEDWGFCKRLEEADIPIWIDHDTSKYIGHRGPIEFGHDMIEMRRQAAGELKEVVGG